MDLFEEYLNKKETSLLVNRALSDRSYKASKSKGIKKNNPKYEEVNNLKTNTDLATYGDALIKFIYSGILLDNVEQLTKEKEKYESDRVFVIKIARHYDLIKYINFDKNDTRIPRDYDYDDHKGKNNNPHKYIATAVEAMIGAIYKEISKESIDKAINSLTELLKAWIKICNEE